MQAETSIAYVAKSNLGGPFRDPGYDKIINFLFTEKIHSLEYLLRLTETGLVQGNIEKAYGHAFVSLQIKFNIPSTTRDFSWLVKQVFHFSSVYSSTESEVDHKCTSFYQIQIFHVPFTL